MYLVLSQIAGFPRVASLLEPSFLALLGIAGVASFLLYAEDPQVSRRAVVATVPWMVAAAALSIVGSSGVYPVQVRPAVSGSAAYVTIYTVGCLSWFGMLQLRRSTDSHGDGIPTLIGAMGVGLAIVILTALLFGTGRIVGEQFFWLAVAPIAAAAIAGFVLLLLGLWYPEAAAYTGAVGGLVVFGHTFSSIATTVAIVSGSGDHSSLSLAIQNLLATVGASGLVGLNQQLLWVWGFVWTQLVIALIAVVGLTAYTRRRPNRGNLVLGAVGAIGVIGGASALLSLVVA